MPFYRIIRLFLLFFFWFHIANAQNFPSKNYTSADELPNNSIRALLVDSNHSLWIGTENGVVKKENDVFTYFFEEDDLALNSCWAIAEDHQNNLWFGSYGNGISIYDGNKFQIISAENGLVHNEITTLFEHKDYMFVGTSDGISIVNIKDLEVKTPEKPELEELFRVQQFIEFNGEIFVITYKSGIWKVKNKNDQPLLSKVNDHKFIYSVFVDGDSIYSSNKGFYSKYLLEDYLNDEEPIISNKYGRSIIWDYVKTKENKIYVASWGIFDSGGGIYELREEGFQSKALEFNIESVEVLNLAYNQKFDRLYVGTKDAGLFEIKLNPIIKFHQTEGQDVLGFAKTNGSSAILTCQGLKINSDNATYKIDLQQLKNWQQQAGLKSKQLLSKNADTYYELDHTISAENIDFYDLKVQVDAYWINSNIGIFAIDEQGELKNYIPIHSEEINFTEDGQLIETHPYGGLKIFSDLNEFDYTYFDPEQASTPTMIVNSLQLENKTYLVSVFSGLYKHDQQGFTSYLQNDIWPEKKLRHITTIGDQLAISSEFGDVYVIKDQDEFKIKRKIPRAEIKGNTISFLKSYNDVLLIGTEKGLTILKDERSIFIDSEQGLKQPFFSSEVNDHYLKIGSQNGHYEIDLDAILRAENLIQNIELKDIYINNNLNKSKSFKNDEQVILDYDENTVLLNFGTNAHPYPHKLSYQYRLNAKDNWSNLSSKPEIFLPFLPADRYNLEVRVLDQSTGFSFEQQLVDFKIKPPFWRTWWFTLIVILIIIGIVLSVYSYQLRQSRNFEMQKSLIQKRFEETKMEALLSQMNPHFIFNAMNSIQNYIMDSDIDNASLFLGDFAKLIRLNLDHCTKPKILLVEEIEYLQAYIRVENTRFENGIDVNFYVDPEIDTYDVEIPTMLLQTFIENVFVHAFPTGAKNPRLDISFKLISMDLLECKIEDNGIGFHQTDTNKLHTSKGVKLVKERLVLIGYDLDQTLKIHSVKNRGTEVILILKI